MPNILNVRKSNEIVAHDVFDGGTNAARAQSRLIVLIHGFNTPEEQAQRAFDAFTTQLEASMRPSERATTSVWQFIWPGDHSKKLISRITYNAKIGNARIAGAELLAGLWLTERRLDQRIVLIGHSLGCRVVLETAAWILEPRRRYRGAHLEGLVLLAAAVPVPLRVAGESFGPRRNVPATHVFYSRRDAVLARAFGPGEYLAGEGRPAVGRAGEPAGRWTTLHDTQLKHGDYWRSREIGGRVAAALGLSMVRHPADRGLAEWAPFSPRKSRARKLRERFLGARQR